MKIIAALILLAFLVSGCESIKIRDGGLALDKNTTAGVEDMGVGKISRSF